MSDEIEQINSAIRENEAKIADLRAALERRANELKEDAFARIEKIMGENEISREGLIERFKTAKRGRRVNATWIDNASGNKYRGGKIPTWLSERMAATGTTLGEYRENYMRAGE